MTITISENENYSINSPLNSWDTNYRLIEYETGKEYLIDIHDVHDNDDNLEEYGGILFQDLVNLNVDEIKDIAWKVE